MAEEPLKSIIELRDLVRAMKAAEARWTAAERTVLNAVSETLSTHVVTEQRKYAREIGECLTDMLNGGKPLALALEETRRIFGAALDPPPDGQDGDDHG